MLQISELVLSTVDLEADKGNFCQGYWWVKVFFFLTSLNKNILYIVGLFLGMGGAIYSQRKSPVLCLFWRDAVAGHQVANEWRVHKPFCSGAFQVAARYKNCGFASILGWIWPNTAFSSTLQYESFRALKIVPNAAQLLLSFAQILRQVCVFQPINETCKFG